MPSVYDTENFAGRVSLAALYIANRRETTRAFDTCFEMWDGDAVATALIRRAEAAPDSALARNLWRYLGRDVCEPVARANAHRRNLTAWARELRAQGKAESDAFFAKLAAERAAEEAAAQPFATELTPAGEQTVIPGCERNASPRAKQLDLFG